MLKKISLWVTIAFVLLTLLVFGLENRFKNLFNSRIFLGYLIVTLLYIMFMILVAIFRHRLIDRVEKYKRLKLFVIVFCLTIAINFLVNIFFEEFGRGIEVLFTAFGAAFGVAYWDLIFMKSKKDIA